MILPEEDEVYITSNKNLFRFNQEYWIYNWKALVWYIINYRNAEKILMGHNFEYSHRFEEEPSLMMLKSIIDEGNL